MFGEKIYLLRKNRKISQEDFATILNTSRQAVSKWERNEAKPDVDKLISIAKLFNVSIDYLLDYEIDHSNVNQFINDLKTCYAKNEFSINIDEIKIWCSKYTNNFELYLNSAEYLSIAFIDNNNMEYLDLALSYINKAIILFTPEYSSIITLNDLHKSVARIYMLQNNHEQAKKYLKENNVYGCSELQAKLEFALRNYDEALEISSEIYLKSSSDIINTSFIEIMVLLKKKKIQDAYNLINWTIDFINSFKKEDCFFEGILCPYIFLKATCEKLLNINNKETIVMLKGFNERANNFKITSETKSLKYYFGKTNQILLCDSSILDTLKYIMSYITKDDVHYQTILKIYEEIIGEKYDE